MTCPTSIAKFVRNQGQGGTMKKSSAAANKLSIHLAVLILFVAAAIIPRGVQSEVSFAVVDQYYSDPCVNRFDEWGVGNPRRIAFSSEFKIKEDGLGRMCGAVWQESELGGNDPNGAFSFKCSESEEDITKNADTVGYYIGDFIEDEEVIGKCKVTKHETIEDNQLCDSDTGDGDFEWCEPYLKCTMSGT